MMKAQFREHLTLFFLIPFCIVLESCESDGTLVCAGHASVLTHHEDTVRFFAIGDFGHNGDSSQKNVANAMEKCASIKTVDFVLGLGDNFYPAGVSSVNDAQWNTSFEWIYKGRYLADVPWFVALGNHDYLTDPTVEIKYTNKCGRWNMPDYFYTIQFPFSGGTIRLVVLDTTPFDKPNYTNTDFDGKFAIDTLRQKIWMDSVFALTDSEWTIVVGHHPLFTGGARVNESNSVRASLLPMFVKHNLPVYFSGHEHDLQHLEVPELSFNQFISGAGSELRPTGIMPYTKFAASVNGFLSVEITKEVMDVYFISSARDTLHHAQIIK